MRRLETGGGAALREARRQRCAHLLFTPAGMDDEALQREPSLLLREAVDEAEARVVLGLRAGALARVAGLERDRGGRDVSARVGLSAAVARPLLVLEVERDGRGDEMTGRADAQRDLVRLLRRARHALLASELHSLAPDRRETSFTHSVEKGLHFEGGLSCIRQRARTRAPRGLRRALQLLKRVRETRRTA